MIHGVSAATMYDDHFDLMRANWDETGFESEYEFKPSRDRYVQLETCGALFILGAFHADKLVGYSAAVMFTRALNDAVLCCCNDAIYVMPEHRKSFLSARLIVETERQAKKRGALYMSWSLRPGRGDNQMFSDRRGYAPSDIIVKRRM